MIKTKNAVPLLLVLGTFGLATSAFAADYYGGPAGTLPTAIQNPAAKPISGTVQNIDPVNNNVQVKDASGMLQLVKVDSDTDISVQGKTVTMNDLKLGDVVTLKSKSNTPYGM